MASIKPGKETSQDFAADLASLRDDVAKLNSSLSKFIRTHSATSTNTVFDAADNARQRISTANKAHHKQSFHEIFAMIRKDQVARIPVNDMKTQRILIASLFAIAV